MASTQTPEINRSYTIADASMLAFCRTYRNIFIVDKAQFVLVNPALADPYATQWLAAIELGEATPTDEIVLDIQTQQTAGVLAAMELCRRKYRTVLFYAELAFEVNTPRNKEILNEFGKNDYKDIRSSQDKMVGFMHLLSLTANKYKTELIAKGFTQPGIDEILTLKENLATENGLQGQKIDERPVATVERINIMNAAYGFCQKVNRASKIVFMDNLVKMQEYLLPGRENPEEDVAFTGDVTKAENGEKITEGTVSIPSLGLTSNIVEGGFAFTENIADGTYPFTVESPGRKTFNGTFTAVSGTTVVQNIALEAV